MITQEDLTKINRLIKERAYIAEREEDLQKARKAVEKSNRNAFLTMPITEHYSERFELEKHIAQTVYNLLKENFAVRRNAIRNDLLDLGYKDK